MSNPNVFLIDNRIIQQKRGGNKNQGRVEGNYNEKETLSVGIIRRRDTSRESVSIINQMKRKEIRIKIIVIMDGEILKNDLILSLDMNNDYWVIDLGAYFHAIYHKGYFIEYGQGDFGHVQLGNDKP